MIINGDGDFLALLIRKLQTVYEKDAQELEDSLDSAEQNLKDQLKKNQGKR